MKENLYKFEKYPDREFPVYLSVQKGRKTLAWLHFHDDIEMMQVLSGEVVLRAGSEQILCKAGEVMYIPPLAVHEIIAESDDAAIRGLVFDLSLLRFEGLNEEYCDLFRESSSMHFSQDSEHLSDIREILEKIASIYPVQNDIGKIEIKAEILRLFAVFLRAGIVQRDWSSSANFVRIRPAMEYIEKNFSRKISVSELSALMNVCDDHCIRLFKAAVSKTPSEYIVDVRLRRALKLLSESEHSIQMISELCGFTNVSYFSKVFRQKLGMTPTEFKKSVLK